MKKSITLTFMLISTMYLLSFYISEKDYENRNYAQSSYQKARIQDSVLHESITRGEELYSDFCMQCHLSNGEGIANTYPPLAKSDWLSTKRTESIHAVKYGQKGLITVNNKTYNSVMTPMGLNNKEVADLMNYIMNSWGNTQDQIITVEEVALIKK